MIKIINYDNIVKELIDTYNTCNPFIIADELDAIVLRVPLKDINGFYHRYENQDLIYINEDLSEEEQIIVCGHELGHMILHRDIDSIFLDSPLTVSGKLEVQADTFAIQLLQDYLNLSTSIPFLNWDCNNSALKQRIRFNKNE